MPVAAMRAARSAGSSRTPPVACGTCTAALSTCTQPRIKLKAASAETWLLPLVAHVDCRHWKGRRPCHALLLQTHVILRASQAKTGPIQPVDSFFKGHHRQVGVKQ